MTNGYMKIAAFSEKPALLVVSRAFYPNWVARVNQVEMRPIIANGALIGVPIPAGNSTIELSYRPTDLFVGAGISAITLVTMLGLALATRKRRPLHLNAKAPKVL